MFVVIGTRCKGDLWCVTLPKRSFPFCKVWIMTLFISLSFVITIHLDNVRNDAFLSVSKIKLCLNISLPYLAQFLLNVGLAELHKRNGRGQVGVWPGILNRNQCAGIAVGRGSKHGRHPFLTRSAVDVDTGLSVS